MRRLTLALPLVAIAAFGLVRADWSGDVSAQGPGPTAGELVAEELSPALHGTIGLDGAYYYGAPGEPDEEVVVEFDPTTDEDDMTVLFGFTGSVVRVDPETGEKTTVADGLPTATNEEIGALGITDLVFGGPHIFALVTVPGGLVGEDDWPIGVYMWDGEEWTLVADLGAYMEENPYESDDAAPFGNLFSISTRGGDLVVVDANWNRVYLITPTGTITELIQFGNVVPTNVAAMPGEPVYVSQIGPFPHNPSTGKVVSVTVPDGEATDVASGISNIIDVEYDDEGNLYALSMGDMSMEDPAEPFTGKILRVVDGEFEVVVDGLMWPTSLDIADDTAWVVTLTGELWRIDDLSTLPEEVETPTATATTAVPTNTNTATATATMTATNTPTTMPPTLTPTNTNTPTRTPTKTAPMPPNTGTGGDSSSSSSMLYLGLAATLLVAAGGFGAVATRKRK